MTSIAATSNESEEKALNLIRIPEKENTQPGRYTNSSSTSNKNYEEPLSESLQINGTLKIEATCPLTPRQHHSQDGGSKGVSESHPGKWFLIPRKEVKAKCWCLILPLLLLFYYCCLITRLSFNLAN